MTGRVTERTTGDPVAGAVIRLLVPSEREIERRLPTATTDQEGRYRIEVPLGECSLFYPPLKPGFWIEPTEASKTFMTTGKNSTVTHDIQVHRGATWRVSVDGISGNADQRSLVVHSVGSEDQMRAAIDQEPISFEKPPPQSVASLNERGYGLLTQPGTSGVFVVRVQGMIVGLAVDAQFDSTKVASLKRVPSNQSARLVDKAGRSATIHRADVSLEGSVATLEVSLPKATKLTLTGRVVDDQGHGVSAADVFVIARLPGGVTSDIGNIGVTSGDGRFRLELPRASSGEGKTRFAVSVGKRGYAGDDSKFLQFSQDGESLDYGELKLAAGNNISVHVIDAQGKSVPYADLQLQGNYALRRQSRKCNGEGMAVLTNLPVGSLAIDIVAQGQRMSHRILVGKDHEGDDPTTIEFAPATPRPTTPANPLASGSKAPEWPELQWSDGKRHDLSEFNGKPLVMYFWDNQSNGAAASLPMIRRLRKHYLNDSVRFVTIHAAGADKNAVEKFRDAFNWRPLSAIDVVDDSDGTTMAQRYGVDVFPSVVVVDRECKVAFHSEPNPSEQRLRLKKLIQAAKESGNDWPIDRTKAEEGVSKAMNEVVFTMLKLEIEAIK